MTHDENSAPALADPLPDILQCGFLNLFAGASGIGKTALIAGLTRAFRDGLPIFGHQPNPVPAIGYMTADRPWADSRKWFDEAGVSDIAHYSVVDDYSLNLERFKKKHLRIKLFMECVDEMHLPPGSLLVVDPLAIFLGGNLLDYDMVALACMELHRAIMPRQLCIIGLVHASKQKGAEKDRYMRPQDRILGSMALLGYSATQMYLMSPDEAGNDNDEYSFLWNPHHRPQQSFNLKRDYKTGLFILNDEQEEKAAVVPLEQLDPSVQSLYELVPGEPETVTTGYLLNLLSDSADRTTVWRRLNKLVETGWIHSPVRGKWQRKSRLT